MKKRHIIILALGIWLFISASSLFAAISFFPLQPNVEQEISFLVSHPEGIVATTTEWNFGDGTIIRGSVSPLKRYQKSGVYIVKVTYATYKEKQVSEQASITVVERRRISYTPSLYPALRRPVTFRAENFFSTQILWDFGDDQGNIVGSPVITHVYTRPGNFTVRALDFGGKSVADIRTRITIKEEKGPRSHFQIYFIQLRFEDGKPYRVVPKDYGGLIAYADIKYEGTGILMAQWLVDGLPFKTVSMIMPFARQTTIDSGSIPTLPTYVPGIHEVTLRIIQPPLEFSLPVLRYFVSVERRPEKLVTNMIDLSTIKIRSLQNQEIPLVKDCLHIPKNNYLLLKGLISNTSNNSVPMALLRIYLDNKLVDQQLVSRLRPLEERNFETSIFYPESGAKTVFVALYNISDKTPHLLFLKKINLQSSN